MSLTLTLVRHGNTDANNERWLQGHVDTNLNANGLKQAEACGERLATDSYDHVYCSDLKRCAQTAEAIISHHQNATIEYLPELRERFFGTLQRKPLTYLFQESKNQCQTVDDFITTHEGESELAFQSRVINAFKHIVKDAQEHRYTSVLVVSHGGPLKCLTTYWINEGYTPTSSDLKVAAVAQGNTAVTKININDKLVYEFNSTSHLKNHNTHQPPPPAV